MATNKWIRPGAFANNKNSSQVIKERDTLKGISKAVIQSELASVERYLKNPIRNQSVLSNLLWDSAKYGHILIFDHIWTSCKSSQNREQAMWNACRHGHFSIVDNCILKKYLTVEKALDIASTWGKSNLVGELMKKYYVDPEKKVQWELVTECANGNLNKLAVSEKSYSKDVVSKCLTVACFHGHINVVNWLIDNTADTSSLFHVQDMFSEHGKLTPLAAACIKSHKTVIRALLQNTPSYLINNVITGKKGGKFRRTWGMDTALHLVIWCDDTVKPLHDACYEGNVESVHLIIRKNERCINEQDNDGKTPLHIACQQGHLEIVEILTVFAEINITNDWYETPLELAKYVGYENLFTEVFDKTC